MISSEDPAGGARGGGSCSWYEQSRRDEIHLDHDSLIRFAGPAGPSAHVLSSCKFPSSLRKVSWACERCPNGERLLFSRQESPKTVAVCYSLLLLYSIRSFLMREADINDDLACKTRDAWMTDAWCVSAMVEMRSFLFLE